MAVSFPQNPNEGDTFTSGNSKFLFTDGKWVSDTSPNSLVSKSGDTMTGLLTLSGDPVSNNQAATKLYVDTVSDVTRMAGEVTMWSGSSVPSGWLECNGQSTSGFTALAAIVGANVPDLRGEFVRGFDNGRGVDSGRALGSSQSDEFESHTHIQNAHGHNLRTEYGTNQNLNSASPNGSYNQINNTNTYINGSAVRPKTATNQNTGGTETRPRNVALMYIIKT